MGNLLFTEVQPSTASTEEEEKTRFYRVHVQPSLIPSVSAFLFFCQLLLFFSIFARLSLCSCKFFKRRNLFSLKQKAKMIRYKMWEFGKKNKRIRIAYEDDKNN